jgi:energy-coupling factor transport system permease protein
VRQNGPLHALAWLAWLAALLIVLAVTRNPIYLGMALLWLAVITYVVAHHTPPDSIGRSRQMPLSVLRFGLIVVLLSTLFNALSVRVGHSVLFHLPAALPLFGGPVTLEAVVYGALNGLALTGIFAAFTLINRVVPLRALIQLIPRAYYPVAIVTTIALTFVPATLYQFQQIREAQAIRGHRLQGVRSWLPLLLPLLTGGMERALQLAEAMAARGFAGGAPAGQSWAAQLAALLGLALLATGLALRMAWGDTPLPGYLVIAGGLALLLLLFRQAGRHHPHTTYRPQPWQGPDWVVSAAALLTGVAFLIPLPAVERSGLFYTPYPALTWPTFALWLGIASWGLLAPAAIYLLDERHGLDGPQHGGAA